MRSVFNFNAGPAMVPEEVLLKAQSEMLNWHDTGMSVMELSHRGSDFKTIAEKAEADLREIMSIPENYKVLFLAGGGSGQFAMVPLNLFGHKMNADYVETGIWSKKALTEASRYGKVNIVAKVMKKEGLAYVPRQDDWSVDENAAYLHYTPNETIDGVEFNWVPQTGNVPLVADMTSMILSRPVDVKQYGIIYAGAQKNLGQAGIAVVIIREDLIKEPLPSTPTLFTYKTEIENDSMYNTPPTYAWYITGLVLEWTKKQGIDTLYKRNQNKANELYQVIDGHNQFYECRVHKDYRSIMNVMFYLHREELTKIFLEEAAKIGLVNLRGHRVSGGVRASIYNAMPEEGVMLLRDFMIDFARRYG